MQPQLDHTLDKQARLELLDAAYRAESAAWNEAIAAHPAVQAFVAPGSSDHPDS